jgi:hypothetical protein
MYFLDNMQHIFIEKYQFLYAYICNYILNCFNFMLSSIAVYFQVIFLFSYLVSVDLIVQIRMSYMLPVSRNLNTIFNPLKPKLI